MDGSQQVVAVLGRGVVPPHEPVAPAADAGLTRGDGCFEGVRVADGHLGELDRHLARMGRSASALEIPFDSAAWMALARPLRRGTAAARRPSGSSSRADQGARPSAAS